MKLSVLIKDFINYISHGSSAPKYAELVFIDPAKITKVLNEECSLNRKDTGAVYAGNWDIGSYEFDDLKKYQICKKHFEGSLSWGEAGGIENMNLLFKTHSKPDRCESLDDVDKRYLELDNIYSFLKKGGAFKTRKELHGNLWFREKGGVYVHFDRDGHPIFGGGGCHRLAIAKILNLPCIPIQVGVIHTDGVMKWRSILTSK